MQNDEYGSCVIEVPGSFRHWITFLDLETEKVPATAGFRMKNGEILRNRWSAFLAGVTSFRRITIIERTGSEIAFLAAVRGAIETKAVAYRATREFDEMILKGRFTNARRAHEDTPFFPSMPGAEELSWRCYKPDGLQFVRDHDCESRDVPLIWRQEPEARIVVMVHLLRDVCELIMAYGEPDAECEEWCARVLTGGGFAANKIFNGGYQK